MGCRQDSTRSRVSGHRPILRICKKLGETGKAKGFFFDRAFLVNLRIARTNEATECAEWYEIVRTVQRFFFSWLRQSFPRHGFGTDTGCYIRYNRGHTTDARRGGRNASSSPGSFFDRKYLSSTFWENFRESSPMVVHGFTTSFNTSLTTTTRHTNRCNPPFSKHRHRSISPG